MNDIRIIKNNYKSPTEDIFKGVKNEIVKLVKNNSKVYCHDLVCGVTF